MRKFIMKTKPILDTIQITAEYGSSKQLLKENAVSKYYATINGISRYRVKFPACDDSKPTMEK
jgi:hypothetical protein